MWDIKHELKGSIEIQTQGLGIKVECPNHDTIEPQILQFKSIPINKNENYED